MQLPSVIGAVGLVAGLLAPAWAQQQPSVTVQLEYDRKEGAASCPDARAVAAGVAERLGYEPFGAAAPSRVRVTVLRKDRTFQARIEMIDPKGEAKAERLLTSRRADCGELAATMELAIAIAIDPFRATDRQPPPGPPAPPPPTPTVALPARGAEARGVAPAIVVSPPAAVRPTPVPKPTTAEMAVTAVGGIGAAPARNLGLAVQLAARRGDFSLGLEGRADVPASVPLLVGEVSTSLLVASLVPCVHWRMVAGCALVTGGALRAAGHGLVDARRVTDPYVALGARVAIEIRVASNLYLAAHGDVSAPLIETELRVGGEELWTTPPLSFLLGLGLAVTFL